LHTSASPMKGGATVESQEQVRAAQAVLLVGYGSRSRQITSTLADRGVRFVIVEKDRAVAEEARALGHTVVEGDATDTTVLSEAGVAAAEVVAITTGMTDETVVHAIRRKRPNGIILTNLSPGYAESELGDDAKRMSRRMMRLLELS